MTKQLITLTDPRSSAAEAYRSLYINLSFSSQEQPPAHAAGHVGRPGEGKSVTLANLAVVAAQMGQRVVLVDCDLRQPQQHELFGLRNDNGLTTLVAGKDGASGAAGRRRRARAARADQRPAAGQPLAGAGRAPPG